MGFFVHMSLAQRLSNACYHMKDTFAVKKSMNEILCACSSVAPFQTLRRLSAFLLTPLTRSFAALLSAQQCFMFCGFFPMEYCLTRFRTSKTTIYCWRLKSLCQPSVEPHLLHASGKTHFKVRNCLFWILFSLYFLEYYAFSKTRITQPPKAPYVKTFEI